MYRYYHVAIAFNIFFLGIYVMNLASIILNTLALFPLYLYMNRIKFFDENFWRWFFVLRLAFDIMGHNYGINLIKSMSHENALLGLKFLMTYIFLVLPTYIALYDYAFGKTVFPAHKNNL